ncbi:MAG: glutathione S-transferase family protein [Alphaproteobacteria bacterium]
MEWEVQPTLYIGNKNYSSWSMRPWLALKWAGVAFKEEVRRLGADAGYGQQRSVHILEISPSGRVPALHVGGVVIYDSLAICEWAAEQKEALWPKDPAARALARSAAAEMHSGFAALRRDLSMNIKRLMAREPVWPEETRRDLARLFSLWTGARKAYASRGPFLFGERSVADAFYAPVVTRLRTYAVPMSDVISAYCQTIYADEAFREWEAGALSEVWTIASADGLYL